MTKRLAQQRANMCFYRGERLWVLYQAEPDPAMAEKLEQQVIGGLISPVATKT